MSSRRHALLRVSLGLALATLLFALGCSPKEKSEIKVAEVEGKLIMLDYFERKMNTIDPEYLPENVETQEGREELLETMINKEVMALKAEELGMDADGMAQKQAEQLSTLKAVTKMRAEVTNEASNPTEREILDYYEMLPRKLSVSYMLFDHEEQAIEARALVEGGEQWKTVAERFEAGDPGPAGDYSLEMRYGTIADDLERAVFQLASGETSQPIDSIYGWFVVRVNDITLDRIPPLDTMRDKVVASVIKQRSDLAIADFIDEIFEEYNFSIDEEVLRLCFDALPEDFPLDPPPPVESLEPLRVKTVDLERALMVYADEVWTVQRFAELYDNSSPFARPMRGKRIGAMRRFLKELAIRELLPVVAEDRGYLHDPEVADEYKMRREQRMVTALHEELISNQVDVTGEDVEEFWAEHKEEYFQPELREVLAVITETEEEALAAQIDYAGGSTWEEIVEKYCVESDIRRDKGVVGKMRPDAESPLTPHVFAMAEIGEVSYPVELDDARWALLKIVGIEAPRTPELADVRAAVAQRVTMKREEEVFLERVEEWKTEYKIVRYPENLMKATYDPSQRPDNSINVKLGG